MEPPGPSVDNRSPRRGGGGGGWGAAPGDAAAREGSLREFVRAVLRQELGLDSSVQPGSPGTVLVPRGALDAWVEAQRSRPTLQ